MTESISKVIVSQSENEIFIEGNLSNAKSGLYSTDMLGQNLSKFTAPKIEAASGVLESHRRAVDSSRVLFVAKDSAGIDQIYSWDWK